MYNEKDALQVLYRLDTALRPTPQAEDLRGNGKQRSRRYRTVEYEGELYVLNAAEMRVFLGKRPIIWHERCVGCGSIGRDHGKECTNLKRYPCSVCKQIKGVDRNGHTSRHSTADGEQTCKGTGMTLKAQKDAAARDTEERAKKRLSLPASFYDALVEVNEAYFGPIKPKQ